MKLTWFLCISNCFFSSFFDSFPFSRITTEMEVSYERRSNSGKKVLKVHGIAFCKKYTHFSIYIRCSVRTNVNSRHIDWRSSTQAIGKSFSLLLYISMFVSHRRFLCIKSIEMLSKNVLFYFFFFFFRVFFSFAQACQFKNM